MGDASSTESYDAACARLCVAIEVLRGVGSVVVGGVPGSRYVTGSVEVVVCDLRGPGIASISMGGGKGTWGNEALQAKDMSRCQIEMRKSGCGDG